MAAGDSPVGICNAALIALGEDPIASLTDASKTAALCAIKYDQVRREVLAKHPWNCAMTVATLAASAKAPPTSQYSTAYPLPADCLRVWNLPNNDGAVWDIQNPFRTGRCLMTNEAGALDVEYVFDLQDTTQFEPGLAKTISRDLAAALAPSLPKSKELRDEARGEAQAALDDARLTGSQENSPKEWDEDVWLRHRR